MEFDLSSSSTLATIFVVSVTAFLLQILFRKTVDKEPPKAKGALPIIGHLHLIGGSRLTHHVLGDMADKYGPIFTLKLGVQQVLVVSSLELAKECFTTHDRNFATRPKSQAAEIMGYNYALIGISPYGDYWRQVRKMLTLEILSQRRVDMLQHIRVSELKVSMQDVYHTWVNNKESTGSDMVKIELSVWFENLILNVMLRILSGKRFPLNDKESVRTRKAVRNFFELFGSFEVSEFIPFLKRFDLSGYKKKLKKAANEVDDILEGWLKEHKRERESAVKQHEGNQVFIDVMISVLKDASKDDFQDYDHDTIIKALCLAILVGATDTTPITLTWAMSLLLNDTKAMKTVQDEIDEHVGRERPVEQSDTKKMVYLHAVIKETLRLHLPGPLAIPHESMEDCVLSGYNIPKGTRLLVNLWKIQHDPNLWPDPYAFKPERFLTSHKNVDISGNNFELLPFSSGRRMCPAAVFAIEAVSYILATVLQHFKITKPSNEPIDMTEGSRQSITKATPLEVLIAPRLSLEKYSTGA